jgi:N-acetylmuramoyl-L-alanine amidase
MTEESPYNSELYEESQKLATRILQGLTESTGATNHGIYESDDMTAVNWSDIPIAVIDLGYLSNEEEEAKLLDEEYQSSVIAGLADGIDLYYNN